MERLTARSSYSRTDPDASSMRMKEDRGARKPWPRPAYNTQNCPLKSQCTQAQGNRRIQVSFKLRVYRRQATENLLSEPGITLRQPRCIEPESVFGNIKQYLGFRRFHLRGFQKVETEWGLVCIAHNMRKLAAI
ncbi:MAG: hypothetical protein EHM81_15060 [Chloroflexi bacterium]|nr:MAG: hypothetical protein EHM81_15060 [Chloroflexota bacterium]